MIINFGQELYAGTIFYVHGYDKFQNKYSVSVEKDKTDKTFWRLIFNKSEYHLNMKSIDDFDIKLYNKAFRSYISDLAKRISSDDVVVVNNIPNEFEEKLKIFINE